MRVRRAYPMQEVDPVQEYFTRVEEDCKGKTIGALARRLKYEMGSNKSRAAHVLRRAIKLPAQSLPAPLKKVGLEFKTVPVGPDAHPFEAMSFRSFNPLELIDEQWEDSDLLSCISNILIVPLYRQHKDMDVSKARVCQPLRWSVRDNDSKDIQGIRREWDRYRDLIRDGRYAKLPGEGDTHFIHIRPKGRNNQDRVRMPDGGAMVRQCFWLNKKFLHSIIVNANKDWMGY